MAYSLVDAAAGFLEARLSRRSFVTRAAMAGSAVTVGAGVDLVLKPGTAYGRICACGDASCGCGSTCCSGYTEFCCSVNGGYNYCPSNTVMGGWWKADTSSYCGGGPRYYMDCNATCLCDQAGQGGFPFCSTGCDGVSCGCGGGDCGRFMTGCLQFRYGQCNQQVPVVGRIVCRVVACVPPWEIDPTCTTANAQDNATAEQDEPCWTPAFPTPPCLSPSTRCEVVGMAASVTGGGYAMVTSFGKLFTFGDFAPAGDVSSVPLDEPVVAMAAHPGGGYYFAAADGGVFAFGGAPFLGSMGGRPLTRPIVSMAVTPGGAGYWLVAADGGVFAFGDAGFHGSTGAIRLNQPVVGMAPSASGNGYWLVAADGGVFAFGDAPFEGSEGGQPLNRPIVGMAPDLRTGGYRLVAADGGVFSFNAPFEGSEGGQRLNRPIVGMAPDPAGEGYWLVAADGGVFNLGGAGFFGSPA